MPQVSFVTSIIKCLSEMFFDSDFSLRFPIFSAIICSFPLKSQHISRKTISYLNNFFTCSLSYLSLNPIDHKVLSILLLCISQFWLFVYSNCPGFVPHLSTSVFTNLTKLFFKHIDL